MADAATTSTLRSGNDLAGNNMTAVSTTLNQAAASVPSGSDIRDSGLLGFYHPYSTTTLTDNYTTTTTTTTSHERGVPAATTTPIDAAAAELVPPPTQYTHETNRRPPRQSPTRIFQMSFSSGKKYIGDDRP